ncbi:MAG: RNA recognition motif domain-containing protein [Phycisphaeraceae bacterium]
MRIYVGNLNFKTTELELEEAFSEFGEVSDTAIISDRETGRSRGFGFVTMPDDEAGQKAIEAFNGQDFHGRTLNVNEARPRTGGGGGGGRSGDGGGYSRDNW